MKGVVVLPTIQYRMMPRCRIVISFNFTHTTCFLHQGMQELSGSQLQELHRECRRVQPVGEKFEEYQRVRKEVI